MPVVAFESTAHRPPTAVRAERGQACLARRVGGPNADQGQTTHSSSDSTNKRVANQPFATDPDRRSRQTGLASGGLTVDQEPANHQLQVWQVRWSSSFSATPARVMSFWIVCLQYFPTFHPSNLPSLFAKLPSIPSTLPTYTGPWITAQRLTVHYTSTCFNAHNLKKSWTDGLHRTALCLARTSGGCQLAIVRTGVTSPNGLEAEDREVRFVHSLDWEMRSFKKLY